MRHLATAAALLLSLAGPASAQMITLAPGQIGEILRASRGWATTWRPWRAC